MCPSLWKRRISENFSSGDLFDFREYVVSSNRPLKDGEEVAAP